MSRSTTGDVLDAKDGTPSAARTRTIIASLELFAQRGVGGTSLQMIADAVGVTKAAIYHQFNTKDEIILAAGEAELRRLESVLDSAEAVPSPTKARQVLLAGVVELAVERRRTMSVILSDPVVLRFFATQPEYHRMIDRFTSLLIGPHSGDHGHIQTAMFMAALSGAVMHPMTADLDDDTLRSELLRLARRFQ